MLAKCELQVGHCQDIYQQETKPRYSAIEGRRILSRKKKDKLDARGVSLQLSAALAKKQPEKPEYTISMPGYPAQ